MMHERIDTTARHNNVSKVDTTITIPPSTSLQTGANDSNLGPSLPGAKVETQWDHLRRDQRQAKSIKNPGPQKRIDLLNVGPPIKTAALA